MKFGIVYNKYVENESLLRNSLEELVSSYSDFQVIDSESLKSGFDFVFAIGGDGTILKVSKFYAAYATPVMGVNLGRLGFLAQSELTLLTKLIEDVKNNNYKIEERSLIECGNELAMNDFVVKGCEKSRTTKFTLKINDVDVCEYVADGLIVSTPTGSTAYCLSAGGPIVAPNVEALIVVPICPHTLTARPLVIPDKEVLTVYSSEGPLSISVDGYDMGMESNKFSIKKSKKNARLAFLEGNDFYNVLSEKFFWGVSLCKKR